METGSPSSVVGGCLCGAVRFEAKLPSLFCCHCHCHWCRRAHGAAFVTWFGVSDDAFTITKGKESLRFYASSKESRRGFCTNCGTTMFYATDVAPGEMHIALACADGPIDRAPKLHVFYEAHVPWIILGDELPKIERTHPGVAKYSTLPERPPS